MAHADSGIENLSLYWFNEHCKHMMLAGSADRGYVSFLRQFSAASDGASRLTLVEAVPFPPAFRIVAARFQTKKFKELFRNTKFTVVDGQTKPQPTAARSSYATATALAPETMSPQRARQTSVTIARPTSTPLGVSTQRMIKYNRYGQRVDEPLPRWDKELVEELRFMGLCNRYFLTRCSDSQCRDSHEGQLTPEKRHALMRVARLSVCSNGTRCEDRDCVAGHHCIHDGRCIFGSACKYRPEMHDVDKVVVRIV